MAKATGSSLVRTATGAEIYDFFTNGWPEGYCYDDYEIAVEDADGKCNLEPDQEYDLRKFGVLQQSSIGTSAEFIPFTGAFNAWRNKTKTDLVMVRVQKGKKDEAIKLLTDAGLLA
jgi:hypothetical protein